MCFVIDLRHLLLQEESPEQIIQRLKTEEDQDRKLLFVKLTDLLLGEDIPVAIRANVVLSRIAYHRPFRAELKTCFERIIDRLLEGELPQITAYELIRLLDRLIKYGKFSTAYYLDVATFCFDYLADGRNNYSIKLLLMSILTSVCKHNKRLQGELEELLT